MVPWKLKGFDKPRMRIRELWTKTRRKTRLMTRKTMELGSVSKIIKMVAGVLLGVAFGDKYHAGSMSRSSTTTNLPQQIQHLYIPSTSLKRE